MNFLLKTLPNPLPSIIDTVLVHLPITLVLYYCPCLQCTLDGCYLHWSLWSKLLNKMLSFVLSCVLLMLVRFQSVRMYIIVIRLLFYL